MKKEEGEGIIVLDAGLDMEEKVWRSRGFCCWGAAIPTLPG